MDTTTPVSVLMIVLLVLFTLYYCLMFWSFCILKFQTTTFNNDYDLCKLVSCFGMLIHTRVSPTIDSLIKIVHRPPGIPQAQNEIANTQGEIADEELALQ
jgi:hypothetical protein